MSHWVDELLPLDRLEYAKQSESLLTDLLWRSEGSSLSRPDGGIEDGAMDWLQRLKPPGAAEGLPEPLRLIPRKLKSAAKLQPCETAPLAETLVLGGASGADHSRSLVRAVLSSMSAPRTRNASAITCVPIHPSAVALQTLHGLVNKPNPGNIAKTIENMGWLGGAGQRGAVARSYLRLFKGEPDPGQGLTGAIDWLLPEVAGRIWGQLNGRFGAEVPGWPAWPRVLPTPEPEPQPSLLSSSTGRTPFRWFWEKWSVLCDERNGWVRRLPARRFVDWALCLLRTGLAFSYMWEAEFFCRVHAEASGEGPRDGGGSGPLEELLLGRFVLARIDPPSLPPPQKASWGSVNDLIARGSRARARVLDCLEPGESLPHLGEGAAGLAASISAWVGGLDEQRREEFAAPIRTEPSTARNQKEFLRYLLMSRSSDDDTKDQADFYSLIETSEKGRHTWFRPGPEWLVVVTSLLCRSPGGKCTLGELLGDLSALGIRAARPTLVGLLEEAGLSTDSPDADEALVIISGF